MVLLAFLLSLAIDRMWDAAAELRSFDWFTDYSARLRRGLGPGRLWDGPAGVLLVLLFPLLVIALVQQLFAAISVVLAFLFAVAVLVYALGPRDLDKDVQRFLNAWEQGDTLEAGAMAREITGASVVPADRAALGRMVIEGIVVAAHERILGVLFWFAVLGPAGALLFRLTCVLRDQYRGRETTSGFAEAVISLHAILGWLPARLTALAYGLMGNFADAMHRWRDESSLWQRDWLAGNRGVLVASGLGALQFDQELGEDDPVVSSLQVRAALALVWRTVVLVLSVVALITLGGWIY